MENENLIDCVNRNININSSTDICYSAVGYPSVDQTFNQIGSTFEASIEPLGGPVGLVVLLTLSSFIGVVKSRSK